MDYINLLMFLAEETSVGDIIGDILALLILLILALIPLAVCIGVGIIASHDSTFKYSLVSYQTRGRIIICAIIRIVSLALAAMLFRDTLMISLGKLFDVYYTFATGFITPKLHEGIVTFYNVIHSYPALHCKIDSDSGQHIVDVLAGAVIVTIQFFLVTRISGLRDELDDEDYKHNSTVEKTYHTEVQITEEPTYVAGQSNFKVETKEVEDTNYANWRGAFLAWIIVMFVFPITFIITNIILTIRELKDCD